MSFRDVKGQDSAVGFLRGSILNDRVGHAYIFLGPKGVGKKLAAYSFAKALNCAHQADGDSCGECPSCRKIISRNHPDVYFVRPEEDKTSVSIGSIRGLIKDIGLKPYEGKKKVYIIDEADSMKHEAANALLKTLESPPSDAVIMLIVESINMLFQTIVSRCQAVRFFPLGVEEVSRILQAEHGASEDEARLLANLSSGRLGEAVEFMELEILPKREALIKGLVRKSLYDIDTEKMKKGELRICLGMMLSWYRDVLAAKTGSPASAFINTDKKDAILREARGLGFGYIEKVIDQILLTGMILDQSANQKLAMGALSAKVAGA